VARPQKAIATCCCCLSLVVISFQKEHKMHKNWPFEPVVYFANSLDLLGI